MLDSQDTEWGKELDPTVGSGKVRPIARVAPIPRQETVTEQEAVPTQAPEPARPVIELVEITGTRLSKYYSVRWFCALETWGPVKTGEVDCK